MIRLPISGLCILTVALCASCANETSEGSDLPAWEPNSLVDSIAAAHGYQQWADVDYLRFGFDVSVNDTMRASRSWLWYPSTDSIVRITDGGEVSYVRNTNLTAEEEQADQQFINDSYWVLMPFYGIWSSDGYTSTVRRGVEAPLSKTPMTMLTVAYAKEGGYTPGDAYDLYVDQDYRLQEWTFRKGGQAAPSMMMSWEGYRTEGGLLLPTEHNGDGPVVITHPNVEVVLREG